jgi:hydrogenase nickel incorporation protein HypB
MEIDVREDIFGANEDLAEQNRRTLDQTKTMALNLMASPGSGKTSLILQTAKNLNGRLKMGVIEGDIASSIDADTVRSQGLPVELINTGGSCHLDANMIRAALANLPLAEIDLLFIENVGNLVCPAEFNLGERLKVVVLSVAEGADKPYKYPQMFKVAGAVILNKIDLMPYTTFDSKYFYDGVRALNREVPVFELSTRTGEGIEKWVDWLVAKYREEFPAGS